MNKIPYDVSSIASLVLSVTVAFFAVRLGVISSLKRTSVPAAHFLRISTYIALIQIACIIVIASLHVSVRGIDALRAPDTVQIAMVLLPVVLYFASTHFWLSRKA
jgi:uncharacterized membrane protein